MNDTKIQVAQGAVELVVKVLAGFHESSLYEDYKAHDGFTDAEYGTAMIELERAIERPAMIRQAESADRLGKLTEDAFDRLATETRYDWHEPDEQGIRAVVIGRTLDNAYGDSALDGDRGEFNVVLFQHGEPVTVRNLATLLAEAAAFRRQANRGAVQTLAEQTALTDRGKR